jgi:putative aldouronate transport system permease protein
MMMCAYTLARKDFRFKRFISFVLFFTLLFNGGLIPSYILTTNFLHLQDTYWVMILSCLVNVWYIFILRTFIQGIPDSIIESALIDGARESRIFFSLIAPLSIPAIATIGLLNLFNYWNNWMTALLYIRNQDLYPLQYLLQKIMTDLQAFISNMNKLPPGMATNIDIPSETVRMALAVVAAGPMLVIMPFFQKYFVRGMTVGSVKG